MNEEQLLKSGERINQLFSTDIKIIQNREVFSYSVDSVLLSRFPRFPKKGLIVDFCAGNGAVGLFASTRTQAQILAVEIQERLADMAERSVRLNGLEEQMEVICDDLKNMPSRIQGSKVRETVRSLSVAGVGNLRGSAPSTRGPEWTYRWCTSCSAKSIAG